MHFHEHIDQKLQERGQTHTEQRALKRTASTSEDSPESSGSGSGPGPPPPPSAFALRSADLSFKLTVNEFETLEGFRAQFVKAVDASVARQPIQSTSLARNMAPLNRGQRCRMKRLCFQNWNKLITRLYMITRIQGQV